MDAVLSAINVIAELERTSIAFEYRADELVILCPYHADKEPSLFINPQKKVFKCRVAGCERSGDFISLLADKIGVVRSLLHIELAARYKVELEKPVDASIVESYHNDIWTHKEFLQELYNRGMNDDLIRYYRHGIKDGRITIPIKSKTGIFVNLLLYLPGAPGKQKMRSLHGRGKNRWHPYEQLYYDHLVICGGPIKAEVAAYHLNPHGIGAISPITGEGNIDVELVRELSGKRRIDVCLDIDVAGRNASRQHCQFISGVCDNVYEIVLPLSPLKYPKGDINDFIGLEHGDIVSVVNTAEKHVPPHEQNLTDGIPEDTELEVAIDAKSTNKRLSIKGVVSSVDTAPYVIPKRVKVICKKDQTECAICRVFSSHQNDEFLISPESSALLEMVSASKGALRNGIMSGIGIPKSCKPVQFDTKEFYNVEDCRVSSQQEITQRAADRKMQPAYCVGSGIELNESYEFTGRMYPHPDTQQSTLLISNCDRVNDSLSNYTPDPDTLEQLKIFQPDEWSVDGLSAKLTHIYDDLAANVTRIYKRENMHLITDLVYHSPLFIPFDGRIPKGWVEGLIIGDSSQGKSEVACGADGRGGLMGHYQLGVKVDCKNATVAGILGGCQQQNNGRYFITWGLMPCNDKRLIIFEELKGMPKEVLAKFTYMRSSGLAEIPKIERRTALARVRILAVTNPRGEMPMSGYSFGIEAISELMGAAEDVRRYDIALCVAASEIDPRELNILQVNRPAVPHVYNTHLSRALVLHAWTRLVKKDNTERQQVEFERAAYDLCLAEATSLSDEFTESIPLLDRGSNRLKVARLAASLACRTFSVADDSGGSVILVRRCHVEYITRKLREIYGNPVFGYKEYTAGTEINTQLIDPEKIRGFIKQLPYPRDFVLHMVRKDRIDTQDLKDWSNYDQVEAMDLLSYLVRKHAMRRETKYYRKTPPFIVLLKDMLDKNELPEKPENLKKREY